MLRSCGFDKHTCERAQGGPATAPRSILTPASRRLQLYVGQAPTLLPPRAGGEAGMAVVGRMGELVSGVLHPYIKKLPMGTFTP